MRVARELHESCMKVFSTLMPWSSQNKSCVRVRIKIFSTLVSCLSCSNENKSYMRVNEGWQARVFIKVFSVLMS